MRPFLGRGGRVFGIYGPHKVQNHGHFGASSVARSWLLERPRGVRQGSFLGFWGALQMCIALQPSLARVLHRKFGGPFDSGTM